jgi:alkylation response protein AidB-like acyl-CoA dehydrogenase
LALNKKLGEFGVLAARIGVACGEYMPTLPNNLDPKKFDYFHEQIAHEENTAFGSPAFCDGLGAGLTIGLPPVLHFASKEVKDKVVPEVLSGQKRICLAITEPFAGSDVANLKCTAKLSDCKQFFIVNGTKKWITNGTFCDYFTTAVRTGGPGIKGISMLLIERSAGLETKLIHTSYGGAAGTSYITYENVKVPVGNLLGKLNRGFQIIMYNFNHERWMIIASVVRASRLVVEECFKWAHQRKVFGKPLIAQPVIRFKLGEMIAQTESMQNWLENITYQMNNMSYNEQAKKLAGPIALLKYQCTRNGIAISDAACQIFGGRAITKTGMGRVIEGFQRSVKYGAILGGSEEIMADLGVRQAMKYYPRTARL